MANNDYILSQLDRELYEDFNIVIYGFGDKTILLEKISKKLKNKYKLKRIDLLNDLELYESENIVKRSKCVTNEEDEDSLQDSDIENSDSLTSSDNSQSELERTLENITIENDLKENKTSKRELFLIPNIEEISSLNPSLKKKLFSLLFSNTYEKAIQGISKEKRKRFIATISNIKKFKSSFIHLENVIYLKCSNFDINLKTNNYEEKNETIYKLNAKKESKTNKALKEQIKDTFSCFSKNYIELILLLIEEAEEGNFEEKGNYFSVSKVFLLAKRRFIERNFNNFKMMLEEMKDQNVLIVREEKKLFKFVHNIKFVLGEMKEIINQIKSKI